jgi:hypothetical protein
MKTNTPSVFQIIRTDQTSGLLAWFPVVTIGLYAYFYFSEGGIFTSFLWLIIGISIISVLFFIFRYRKIAAIFEDNIEVSSIVTEVYIPPKDAHTTPHVDFTYEFQGEKYQSRNSISEFNKQVKSLTVGQTIMVVLDSNNPKSAFVKELFLGK